jgi:hypothetical protein
MNAIRMTINQWGELPKDGFITYVNASKIKSSNPGCCFKKAGFKEIGKSKKRKLILLQFKEEKSMSNNANPAMVTTGQVRLSYVHLFKPYANQPNQEPKYSVTILLPKSDVATKQRIDVAINAAIQQAVQAKWNGARPPMPSIPIHDGDGVRQSGEPYGPECKGHWVITASSKQQPAIVDLNLNPILNQSDVYSGMYARVNINFFGFANSGNKGIGCGLGPVQKIGDGEPLSSGQISAEAAFGSATPMQQQYQAPAFNAPVQQPVQPQYNNPVQQPMQPQYGYGTPAQQPAPVYNNAPVQQPIQRPVQQPMQPQYNNQPQYPQAPMQQPMQQPMQPQYGYAPVPQQQPQQPMQQVNPITGMPMGGVMGINDGDIPF